MKGKEKCDFSKKHYIIYYSFYRILLHYIKITEVNLLNKNKLLENIDFKVDTDKNAEMALIENFLVNDKLSHSEISTILLDMFVIGINSVNKLFVESYTNYKNFDFF